ncbi:MAG: hypothetical protein E7399_07800 [Ruminococcaceae bacterium]|nr:hypothetical protein [Oscillospiraceae bacterium]
MIRIMMGEKGTGKTGALIQMTNAALDTEKGKVVCINKGNRLSFDLKHPVRLIDTEQFEIKSLDIFLGFIEGVIAHDFDVTHIFIDSVLKCAQGSLEEMDDFLARVEAISEKFDIDFTITLSAPVSAASENMKRYLVEF